MTTDLTIELREFAPTHLERDALDEVEARELFRSWNKHITIEWPTPKTDDRWRLTAGGYVGTIPLSSGRLLRIEPKTPIGNIFRMLEYAHNVDINPGDSLVHADTIEELYSRLAGLLAQRVMRRLRGGIYRTYVPRQDHLPFVRGSMDVVRQASRPWMVKPHCRYQEHTADILENQILGWTLRTILRQGIGRDETLRSVRKAYRSITSLALSQPVTGSDCDRVFYHRLNQDYQTLHALCRFFLDYAGPSHRSGDRRMVPFLIDMAQLYESFVLRWLQRHAPEGIRFQGQYKAHVGESGGLKMSMDIVMRRTGESVPMAILDTKYKVPESGVSNADVYQVQSYAALEGAPKAILIYPILPSAPFDSDWGESGVRVRTAAFGIEGDLHASGTAFLDDICPT